MMGCSQLGLGSAAAAAGLDQLRRIKQFAAVLALIAPGLLITAVWTYSPHKTVRQETLARGAVELFDTPLVYIARRVAGREDRLYYLCLLFGGGTSELVEGDIEPFIDLVMHDEVAVAKLLGAYPLLQRAGLGGCTILVGPADIEGLVAPQPAETGENVRRENLNQVSEVGYIVDIGQSRGDQSLLHSLPL